MTGKISVFQEQLSLSGWRRNRPKGESAFPLLDFPTLFQHALSLAGYVSVTPVIAANVAAARCSHFRLEPARKKTLAVSHRS
ncbi:hypothetical protein, partial [Rahnella sp. ChDrAdgB13]|uniref:hypothetical protein n=1 Tax=Rahnella sp. ChDrAdgB13 TaxID=1850581 RepID=UPI001AD86838